MRNFKITIEYQGTNYNGWQTQKRKPSTKTIQGTIEKALGRILREKVSLVGSGRTDSGVHALAQVANFKTARDLSGKEIKRSLNATLPEDIGISNIREVLSNFHARFDVKSKVYRYSLLNSPEKPIFNRQYHYRCLYKLDLNLMRKESEELVGRHNFKSFQAAEKKERSSIRRLKKITIKKHNGFIYFDIEAEGFLYKMARNIVGTLIDIGRGRLAKGSIKRILRLKNRKFAGSTVPAKGLCLMKVNY